MARFSRRDIQTMLDSLSGVLNEDDAKRLTNDLNVPFPNNPRISTIQDTGRDRRVLEALVAEWEIAILYALIALGHVSYERQLGDSYPDIHFVNVADPSLTFVADITCISDESSEEGKRYEYFIAQFLQVLSKHKLSLSGFRFEIDGRLAGGSKSQKMKLSLPSKQEIPTFIAEHFDPMVRRVVAEPTKRQSESYQMGDVCVTVIYEPDRRHGTSASYPSHTAAYSLKANPVYRALTRKTSQLADARHRRIKNGIIICDAATACLREGIGGASFTLEQIVRHFFKQHRSVDLVLVLRTASGLEFVNGKRPYWIESQLFRTAYRGSLSIPLVELLLDLRQRLPRPVYDSFSAFGSLRNETERLGKWFFGGGQMSSRRVRVSARGIHELLAGKISNEAFLARHGKFFANAVRGNLENGRMIRRVELERQEHEDDDWLLIEFGDPDPAAEPFRPPRRF